MTLKQLQDKARGYLKGEVDQEDFCNDILEYLVFATPEDYLAFAMWLNESKTEH